MGQEYHIKPILSDHQVKWRCESQSDITFVTKLKPKMLLKIQLTNIMPSKIGNIGIRKLRKALVDNKRASVLSVKRTPECQELYHPYDPSIYLLKLRLPKALSSLDLTFISEKFAKEDLIIFTSNVQKFTLLENLVLNFAQFKDIDPDEARIWSSLFKKTQNLKTLNITHPINLWKSLEGTQIFLESLQYPKNLTRLSLDLSLFRAGNSDNVVPETLLSSLASIPSFKSLKIHLPSQYLDQPKPIKNLLAQIQLFTQLEKFHLGWTEYFPLTGNNAVFQSVLQITQCLTQLKNLKIFLSTKDTDSEKAILLVQNLKQLTRLKILSLHFLDFHPTYELIEILSNSISQLNLASFQLILDPNGQPKPVFQLIASLWKNKKELTPLFVTLPGFKELTTLNLNLVTFEISNKESREISGALKELKQLKSLTLELPQLNSSKGLQTFVSSLKDIRCLSSLNLNFGRNCMSKEEMRFLESGLGDCKSLESLKLDIQQTEKLTLEDIRCLILGWKGLNLLRNLQLELVNMKTTNEEVAELAETMAGMKRLEYVKLNVSFAKK